MTLLPSRLAVTVAFQGSLSSLSHHPYVTSAVCSTFTDLEDSRRHRPIGRLHDIWTLYRKIVVALRQPWRRRDALQNGSALRTTLSCYEREKCEFKEKASERCASRTCRHWIASLASAQGLAVSLRWIGTTSYDECDSWQPKSFEFGSLATWTDTN